MKNCLNQIGTSFRKGETVSVITVLKGKQFLDYLVPTGGVVIGSIVKVPIKNKFTIGLVWSKSSNEKNLFLKKKNL